MTLDQLEKWARSETGVLLPETPPEIGEMVLKTLYANPTASFAAIVLGLVSQAPNEETALEIVMACFQLALCKERGQLFWLQGSGQSILAGTRRALASDGIVFGQATWPMSVLVQGPPLMHVVRMPNGPRRVYMVGDLRDAVVRMSEAVALGMATVEALGGKLIEDRQGPEVAAQSAIEQNMKSRAQHRAMASKFVDRLEVNTDRDPNLRGTEYQRVPMVLAMPSLPVEIGTKVHHEDNPQWEWEIESRVNEDYVVLVATHIDTPSLPGGGWVRADGRNMMGERPEAAAIEGVPMHIGFTDEPSRAAGVTDGSGEPGHGGEPGDGGQPEGAEGAGAGEIDQPADREG